MNCDEARLLIGADPDAHGAELEQHLSGCADCRRLRDEMRALEPKVRRALETLPTDSSVWAQTVPRAPSRAPARLWALAATVVAALAAALLLWGLRPPTSLAADVVRHVDGEPQSWSGSQPIGAQQVVYVLQAAGVELTDPSNVVYARTCRFRGHDVPHLVVLVDHRPYTVMVLRFESLREPQHFNEGGYAGMLVPTTSGSLAILGLGAAEVDAVAREVFRQLRFVKTP